MDRDITHGWEEGKQRQDVQPQTEKAPIFKGQALREELVKI